VSDEEDYDNAFDIQHIDHDTAQQIIDWAVATAGLAIFMDHMPNPQNGEELVNRLEAMIQGVRLMVDNMPESLLAIGTDIAIQSVEDSIYEEKQVEAFRAELDEL
jgi:hypothetical protein